MSLPRAHEPTLEFFCWAIRKSRPKRIGNSLTTCREQAAHHFAASGDQALIEKRGEHAGRVDAANFRNFRAGDWLFVGDYGERFERRHGEAQWRAQAFDEAAHYVVMLRLGVHLVAAGYGADFDAAFFCRVARNQLIKCGLYDDFFFAERQRKLLDRGGFVCGVDDGLERSRRHSWGWLQSSGQSLQPNRNRLTPTLTNAPGTLGTI